MADLTLRTWRKDSKVRPMASLPKSNFSAGARRAGQATSPAKAAARANGAKGGRPRKSANPT